MLRVSDNTSSFSELTLLKPRAFTLQEVEFWRATCRPGTRRKASGMLVAPDRRRSS